jgi:hypothetical protein
MWNRRKRRQEKLALQDEVDEALAETERKITHRVGQVLIAEVCDPDMPELERPHDIVYYTSYEPLVCTGVDQYGSGTYTWLKQDRGPNTIVAKYPDLTLTFVPDSPESTCELAIIVQILDGREEW